MKCPLRGISYLLHQEPLQLCSQVEIPYLLPDWWGLLTRNLHNHRITISSFIVASVTSRFLKKLMNFSDPFSPCHLLDFVIWKERTWATHCWWHPLIKWRPELELLFLGLQLNLNAHPMLFLPPWNSPNLTKEKSSINLGRNRKGQGCISNTSL